MKSPGEQSNCSLRREKAKQFFRTGRGQDSRLQQGLNLASKRNQMRIAALAKHGSHHLFVLLRFQRAGGVNHPSAGANSTQRSAKNPSLAFRLSLEILGAQPMADLRITTQRSCSAAGHIDQRQVEDRFLFQCRSVRMPALNLPGMGGKPLSQSVEPLGAWLASNNPGVRLPLRKNQCFAPRRGTRIEDLFNGRICRPRSKFCYQLRTFILKPDSPLLIRRRTQHIPGDDCTSCSQQLS